MTHISSSILRCLCLDVYAYVFFLVGMEHVFIFTLEFWIAQPCFIPVGGSEELMHIRPVGVISLSG